MMLRVVRAGPCSGAVTRIGAGAASRAVRSAGAVGARCAPASRTAERCVLVEVACPGGNSPVTTARSKSR